ncbi:MAG TPA: flagellar hook protein FlgE [Acidimicrobiales bacterium]|nr:flagellar hook protein FlgE [Acidimicrobiales bacterium]
MEQSLLAAVSGIESNQTYLDVIGNNIANANTVGYKSEDAVFTDLLAEQVAGATAPSAGGAGVNPIAVGSGVRIGAVTNEQSQGSLEQTNQPTDVAIQGSGFLVAEQGGQLYYTRAGHLTIDANGDLATPTGGLIQGWQANAQGVINPNAPTTGLSIPTGKIMNAQATTEITVGGNLPAWSGTGTPPVVTTTIDANDTLGNTVPVTLTFTGVAGQANQWTIQGTVPNGSSSTNLWSTLPTITFSAGNISSISGVTANSDGSFSLPVGTMPPNFSFPAGDTWKIDFPAPGSIGAVTQFAGAQTFAAQSQDGNPPGMLESFAIGEDGVITGAFSNGRTEAIGQLALATFSNPGGLADTGNLMYTQTPNSGQPQIGTPNTGGRGSLIGGSLESSNVDLASQLTDLIVAQEAYQANTKVVATTSQAIQSLVNMP